jgi:glycosyltransferase involved in cell wall biosynthesis
MPDKILMIHSSNEMFGSDQVLLRTALALKTAKWTPLVLLPNDLNYTGELSRELERQGVAVRSLPLGIVRRKYLRPSRWFGYLFALVRAVTAIRRIIRTEGIKLVYSATGAVLSGALAAALTRTAHVWHLHEIPLRPRWAVKRLAGYYARFARGLIVVSQAVFDHWAGLNEALRTKMTVIHNGVDPGFYRPSRQMPNWRRKLRVRPGEVLVGCLGRIGTWKGQEVLLRALHRLGPDAPGVRGLIAGGTLPGEEKKLDRLRALARELGVEPRVTFLPFQQDVRSLLEALDIVAVPSVKPEPFGMVILEAMAYGRPVIATNIGGSPEVVVDGKTGHLVPANDAEALAEAIRALSAPGRRRRFGQAGRRRVAEQFTLTIYQRKIIAFFSSLNRRGK